MGDKYLEETTHTHHSRIKSTSPKWECILDSASTSKITLWNTCALSWQDSTSQDTTGPTNNRCQPCSRHSESWLSLHTEEVQTWDTPLFSSSHLDSYLLDWSLQGFSHVLDVIREPLLRPLHSHTLYHATTNRSDVKLVIRLIRLLIHDTKSPRVKKTIDYICHKSRVMGLILGSCLILPCLVTLV
jgi:hypothetical protein